MPSDVLAVLPHVLGVWPHNCVAILTAAAGSVGFCLRIEIPTFEQRNDPEFMASWVVQLSELLAHDSPQETMFVVVYCPDYDEEPKAERSSRAQQTARSVIDAVLEAGMFSGHRLQGAWCVQGDRWWPVNKPDELAAVAEIRSSPLYTALVYEGSVVHSEDQILLRPQPYSCDRWPGIELENFVCDLRWSLEHLHLWHAVMSSFEEGAAPPVSRQELVKLIVGCVDPLGAQLIAVMTLTGNSHISQKAFQQSTMEGTGADSMYLLQVVQISTGNWHGYPSWEMVDRCVVVIDSLISVVYHAMEKSRSPQMAVAGAALWVMRGYMERFRGRGTRVQQCLEQAQRLMPEYVGIQRLRQLCAINPVPEWAADQARAWKR